MDNVEKRKEELVEQLKDKWIEGEPYVFVSYASRDWEKVYPTIIELRNRGFNVYIDTELQEVATKNWLDNVRDRLFDVDVKGIIAFLSSNYLRSYACMIELLLNQSEELKDDRGDSLPVIYVSLDSKMGCLQDIHDYIRTDAVRKESKNLDARMQPEERSVLEETLSNCKLKDAMSRDEISKDIDKISNRHDIAIRMEKYVLANTTIPIQLFKSSTSCVDMLENNFVNSKNKDIELQKMQKNVVQSCVAKEEKIEKKDVIDKYKKINKKEYWGEFVEYAFGQSGNREFLESKSPIAPIADRNWYSIWVGSAKVNIELSFNTRKNSLRTALLIRDKGLLESFEKELETINMLSEVNINKESQTASICQFLTGVDFSSSSDRIVQFDWFIGRTCFFKKLISGVLGL